ncbi:MAG TPA: class I SAM-dependent methyltransferase [Polyangiaceae bacterium]|nr:class I SAM-dependent methyltransferase [Polyangiaceae bacterium]
MSDEALRQAFGYADRSHFDWQTTAPGIAERERALVESAFLPLGSKVLDLGCGEGATLFHLGEPEGALGIELFEEKVAFARSVLPKCRFMVGSVYELPIEADSVDQVIVRDVVHHLMEPQRFVDECARVLMPGGRIDVLEPCRYNPLICLHALTNKAERDELRSTPTFLQNLLATRFNVESVNRHQPLPIHRIVYHPKLGKPALASTRASQWVDSAERLAGKLMPRWAWAYIHIRAFAPSR